MLDIERLLRDAGCDAAGLPFIQNLIDAVPLPIYFKNRQGVFVGCNTRFETFIGLSRAELLGRTVYDIAPAELAEIYDSREQSLLADGGTRVHESEIESADGRKHTVILHTSTFEDIQGRIAGLVGAVLDLTELRDVEREVQQQANRDQLTGLFNRRSGLMRCGEEIERARRYRHPVSVLMLDLDHFALLNQRFGSVSGDRMLQDVAQQFPTQLRSGDLAIRYDGDRFLLVLPQTEAAAARRLAERLRGYFAARPHDADGERIELTVSIGVVSFPHDAGTVDELIASVQQRLVEAKEAGRNRVISRRHAASPRRG